MCNQQFLILKDFNPVVKTASDNLLPSSKDTLNKIVPPPAIKMASDEVSKLSTLRKYKHAIIMETQKTVYHHSRPVLIKLLLTSHFIKVYFTKCVFVVHLPKLHPISLHMVCIQDPPFHKQHKDSKVCFPE